MKETIYQLWQEGRRVADIAEKYSLTVDNVQKILSQTPKERKCRVCGITFKASKGAIFCSKTCRVNQQTIMATREIESQDIKPKKKPIKSIADVMAEINQLIAQRGEYVSYGDYMREQLQS